MKRLIQTGQVGVLVIVEVRRKTTDDDQQIIELGPHSFKFISRRDDDQPLHVVLRQELASLPCELSGRGLMVRSPDGDEPAALRRWPDKSRASA